MATSVSSENEIAVKLYNSSSVTDLFSRLGFLEKRVYGGNNKGLANRLEGYSLAYAFHRCFGHRIVLDWPEFDVIRLGATTPGRMTPFDRCFAQRFYRAEEFSSQKPPAPRILLKTMGRNHAEIAPHYLAAAAQVHLRGDICAALTEWFTSLQGRPVVAAHVRRGDFPSVIDDPFDFRKTHQETRHLAAVPLWWYQSCLRAMVKTQPNLCVVVCTNGVEEILQALAQEFNVTTFDSVAARIWPAAEERKKRSHVVDLFGLACCNAVLGQPYSSFSHWATRALRRRKCAAERVGGQSLLLPPNGVSRKDFSAVIPEFSGPMFSDTGAWAFDEHQAGQRFRESEDFCKLDFGISTGWLDEAAIKGENTGDPGFARK